MTRRIALEATYKHGIQQPHIERLAYYLAAQGKHDEHLKMLAAKWCKDFKAGLNQPVDLCKILGTPEELLARHQPKDD